MRSELSTRFMLLALAVLPCASLAGPASFEAQYAFLRNGREIGEARLARTSTATRWETESSSSGTRGLARFMGFRESSRSSGEWHDGEPRPLRFSQEVRAALQDHGWEATFDWAAGKASTRHGDGDSVLELAPGTLDPLSVDLRIAAGLDAGERHWQLPMVEEDEVKEVEFRVAGEARLDTALGCLDTLRVEKVREPDSKRYTRTWYAKDHGWAPVRVEHGKTGGDHMESRIVTLLLEGVPVAAGPACE